MPSRVPAVKKDDLRVFEKSKYVNLYIVRKLMK